MRVLTPRVAQLSKMQRPSKASSHATARGLALSATVSRINIEGVIFRIPDTQSLHWLLVCACSLVCIEFCVRVITDISVRVACIMDGMTPDAPLTSPPSSDARAQHGAPELSYAITYFQ